MCFQRYITGLGIKREFFNLKSSTSGEVVRNEKSAYIALDVSLYLFLL